MVELTEICMNSFFRTKAEGLGLGLVVLVSLLRFYGLDGGLVLGEPDEFIHQEVAESFRQSPWPVYAGAPWFFQIPLYPFLGFLVSFVFPDRYLALRIVSVAASLFLTLGTFWFIGRRFSPRAGFLAALLLALSPFSIYISRLALLDSSVVALGLLSLYALEMAGEKKSLVAATFSGLLLAASLAVKYTALIYLMVFLLYFVFRLIGDNRRSLGTGVVRVYLMAAWPLILSGLLISPILLVLRSHAPYLFKLQLLTSLGFVRDFWRIEGNDLSFLNYAGDLPWWLTAPVFLLSFLGLSLVGRHFRKFPIFLLGFWLTVIIVGPFRPFYPRYFYPFVPFLVIFAGLGLDFLLDFLKSRGRVWLTLLVIFLILPTAVEAFQSTRHRLIEDTGDYILKTAGSQRWIFANYWPNYFGRAAESQRATWLSDSVWDGRAFVPDLADSPLTVLSREGGFVILEEKYSRSKMFIHSGDRRRAWEEVMAKYQPQAIIEDRAPNFPHFTQSVNRAAIYWVRGRERL